MEKIILASASPRRKELLEKAGIRFTVIPSTGEEEIKGHSPAEVVENLSREKAFSVAKTVEDDDQAQVIIGADTIVAYGNEILGKPSDEKAAKDMLMKLQGNTHQVYTGVTFLTRKDKNWDVHTFSECTEVSFYPVTEEEIKAYIRTGEPMDKAGSYGIQGKFGVYVKEIRGDYHNVVGLPIGRLLYEMKKQGSITGGELA